MKKLVYVIVLVALFGSVLLFGRLYSRQHPGPQNNANGIEENGEGSAEEILKKMSLAEKAGQMVIVGLEGTVVNNDIEKMITDYHVGGIILFRRNIVDSSQLLDLLNSLKETNAKNRLPLFLSVDEEGGRVSRLPADLLEMPEARLVGEVNDAGFAYQTGLLLAERLKIFGFNLNFAPVLDINSNPFNPVIGSRAYGNNPDVVTRIGIQTAKGLRDGGIIPVVKHFPGHGDTDVDSHVGLPVLDFNLERLKTFQLQPFMAAIDINIEAVMTAHILLPRIDNQYPASLSEKTVTEILKEQLNFNGIAVTDDLTMGAISNYFPIEQAVVQAVKAGNDLLLVCHDVKTQYSALEGLIEAVESGEIAEERINSSVLKIIRLKQKYNLREHIIREADIAAVNKKTAALLETYLGDY